MPPTPRRQANNAIAHGKSEVLTTDFGVSTADIAADLPLVKLLARLVIEALLH